MLYPAVLQVGFTVCELDNNCSYMQAKAGWAGPYHQEPVWCKLTNIVSLVNPEPSVLSP